MQMERYEEIKKLGAGNFGVAKLMRDKTTNELVAMKFIARGPRIDENVAREIINHRALRHPNIVQFKKVLLTPTHLAIVMEYAAGGELFDRICNAGRFSEDEARFFFQQLISGVSYIHSMKICHRDLKLENTLLDGGAAYRLKICDFGYSKSSVLHSRPTSTVGTPAYIAPEVVARKEYDGKLADVWSCGVTLYVMLVGAYPFEDPEDPKNFKKTIQRIQNVQYRIPEHVQVSEECRHLLARIFVFNPEMRFTISDIKRHPWFLRNLPRELKEDAAIQYRYDVSHSSEQSNEEIMSILAEAKTIVQDKSMLDEEENEAEEEGEIYHDADVGGVSQQTDEEEDIVCYKSPEQKQEYAYQRKLGDMQRVIYHDKNWEARLQ